MLIPLITVLGMAFAQEPAPQPQGRPQPQPQPPQQQPRFQPPQPPDFSALKSYLNLTDAQIRQMQQARDKAAKEAGEKDAALRPQIEERRRALADLLDKDNPDPTAVGKTMLEIRGLERQLRQAHEAVRDSGISVMTAEQKSKFKAIQDAALLPQATRDAQRLGLVPPPPSGPGQAPSGPQPRMQGPMVFPGSGPQPGPGGPGQPIRAPMPGGQGPMQPPPPGPRQPVGAEGER